jgi:hypothetical protein
MGRAQFGIQRRETMSVKKPRIWALPQIPLDVLYVRDDTGVIWMRSGGYWRDTTGVENSCREYELISGYGPITEVE